MLEEGSKPHPENGHGGNDHVQNGPFQPALRSRGLIASPWFPAGAAIAVALLLGAAILAASAQGQFPALWPALLRNYWLVAALAVLACLGCGKDVQLGALADLARGRMTGDLVVALAADAAIAAAIVIGASPTAIDPETGIAAFFIADASIACALLGRRLMASPRILTAESRPPSSPAEAVMVEAGQTIPFDAVVIAGRSEVNEGPIGGSPQGAVRAVGDAVRRGARNGDGRLAIEPAVEPPLLRPQHPAAPRFAPGFDAAAALLPVAMVAIAAMIGFFSAQAMAARIAIALLAFALMAPISLALVRPLIHARIRAVAANRGWRLNGTAAVDALMDINALVLGRIGVVTRPELEIVAVHPALDVQPAELIAAATSLAQSSESVWAHTLLRHAVDRKLRLAPIVEWYDEIHADGIGLCAATQGGQTLIAGPREWLEEKGIRTSYLEEKERESLLPGRRALWVAQIEPVPFLLGVVVAGERLKPGAAEMCKNAKRFGLTGALLDRRDVAGGVELARYLNLRLVEDDALAQKAMATEWETLRLRPVIAQHRGDALPAAPAGPRLLVSARLNQDGGASAGGWVAATERGDPRLILDLLRLMRGTRRRERMGYLLAYVFCLPGLWTLATGHHSAAMVTLGAAVGLLGAVANAQLASFSVWTSTDADEER
jgi:cation transport ATPase